MPNGRGRSQRSRAANARRNRARDRDRARRPDWSQPGAGWGNREPDGPTDAAGAPLIVRMIMDIENARAGDTECGARGGSCSVASGATGVAERVLQSCSDQCGYDFERRRCSTRGRGLTLRIHRLRVRTWNNSHRLFHYTAAPTAYPTTQHCRLRLGSWRRRTASKSTAVPSCRTVSL